MLSACPQQTVTCGDKKAIGKKWKERFLAFFQISKVGREGEEQTPNPHYLNE